MKQAIRILSNGKLYTCFPLTFSDKKHGSQKETALQSAIVRGGDYYYDIEALELLRSQGYGLRRGMLDTPEGLSILTPKEQSKAKDDLMRIINELYKAHYVHTK